MVAPNSNCPLQGVVTHADAHFRQTVEMVIESLGPEPPASGVTEPSNG